MDTIRTERLLLRRARHGDLEDIHAVLSDPRAMRYWSTPPHATVDQTRDWLGDMIAAPADVSDDFLVEFEGGVVGKIGCWQLPEIGFIFHPGIWRRGIAGEALRAVLPWIFGRHALPAITADVDPRNAASLALLARAGFRETGRAERTWLVAGEWCNSIYLALRRPD
ncbi:MAG: GNAT family N-acetyltransferase [Rhizobiaceae bacterium]|nr:MAG: GNAT family N-acetyltransferase [Rhizobiaceae bacterium]CAG1012997.1 diamine N-acetyltransferase [Rhizobiaceae bacterium]